MAAPAIMPSVRGVSSTRLSPYLAHRPSVAPKTPPLRPTSSPMTMTRSSRSISSSMAERIASRMFSSAMSVAPAGNRVQGSGGAAAGNRLRVDAFVRIVGGRLGAGLGALRGLVDLGLDLGSNGRVGLIGQDARGAELVGEHRDRIGLLERLDLGRVAIAALVVVRRVARQAHHLGLDEGGTVAAAGALVCVASGGVAGQHVTAVDVDARHPVAGG